MNCDSFFMIGKTHAVCQDYATAGPFTENRELAGLPYVIISDGCSSSPHSDFGARFIVRAAEVIGDDVTGYGTSLRSWSYCAVMKMPTDCLCATLLKASVKQNGFQTMVIGDGVVAARDRSGRIHVRNYEFPSGAPFYLRYLLDKNIYQQYLKKFGFKVEVSSYLIDKDKWKFMDKITYENPDNYLFLSEYNVCEFDLIALFSDGARSFTEPIQSTTTIQQKSVHFMDVIMELMAFKNYNGFFVQRRVRRVFEPKLGNGWTNMDDLSVGVIVV